VIWGEIVAFRSVGRRLRRIQLARRTGRTPRRIPVQPVHGVPQPERQRCGCRSARTRTSYPRMQVSESRAERPGHGSDFVSNLPQDWGDWRHPSCPPAHRALLGLHGQQREEYSAWLDCRVRPEPLPFPRERCQGLTGRADCEACRDVAPGRMGLLASALLTAVRTWFYTNGHKGMPLEAARSSLIRAARRGPCAGGMEVRGLDLIVAAVLLAFSPSWTVRVQLHHVCVPGDRLSERVTFILVGARSSAPRVRLAWMVGTTQGRSRESRQD